MSYGYAPPHYAAYPQAPVQQVRRSAPPSVHTVAILQYLGAALQFAAAAAVLMLPADNLFAGQVLLLDSGQRIPVDYLVAGVFVLVGLIAVAFGRAVQRGRQWARVLLIILSLVAVAGAVLPIVATGDPTSAGGLLVPVLILALLNTRAARSWFRLGTW